MRPFFALLNECLNPPQGDDLAALDLFENLNIGPKINTFDLRSSIARPPRD
jgi:hypothetical protein